MYTRSQIPLRSIRLRSIEDRQPKHTRVLTVAGGGVDLSLLDSTFIPKTGMGLPQTGFVFY